MADAGESHVETKFDCRDFAFLQERLREMRLLDDRIVNALNTSIPTQSFAGKVNATDRCRDLYNEMNAAHRKREGGIKKCIAEVSTDVQSLKQQFQQDQENVTLQHKLRKEQSRLRMIQSELNIEEIVQERSMKVFHERCRQHYIPPKEQS